VLFDAVGTLIYADPPVSAVYSNAAKELGLALNEATVERRFADAFSNRYADSQAVSESTSEAIERERWRSIVATVFPELGSTEELFARLWEHFSRAASWRVYSDAADCLARLHEQGILLGVASNFDDRLFGICRRLPPLDHLEHVFVSSQVGYRKPAVRFYRAVEQKLALRPAELLLVGDDYDSDYLGAGAVGWQAAFLDRSGNGKVPTAVRSLAELSSTGLD
jgi:putative hydrolase of the HAD superfamily